MAVLLVLSALLQVANAASGLDATLAARPESFSLLRTALTHSGFGDTLERHPRRTTFFAPTDAAFRRLLDNWGIGETTITDWRQRSKVKCLLSYAALGGDYEVRTLGNKLPRHGFSGHRAASPASLCDSSCAPGPRCWRAIVVHKDRHGVDNLMAGGGAVTSPDILWQNGIIHVVDQVPNPVFWAPSGARTLGALFDAHPEVSIMRKALQAMNLERRLEANAKAGAKYTIFAPTDAAMKKYLQGWSMSEGQFMVGGYSTRRTDYLLRLLIARGFADESDLWRSAAVWGNRAHIDTLCPCGGSLTLDSFGDVSKRSLHIGGGKLVAGNQMWLGGPVHIIDVMPFAPCWSHSPLPTAPPATTTVRRTTSIAPPQPQPIMSKPDFQSQATAVLQSGCFPSIDHTLDQAMGSNLKLMRQVLQENGLAERLEAWRTKVTLFTPTDEALQRFMKKYGLENDHLFQQSWHADGCVHKVFKGLVHESKLGSEDLRHWASSNSGSFALPTICSECTDLQIFVQGRFLLVGKAPVVKSDQEWCNGMLHIIDEVPVPRDWAPGTRNCRMSRAGSDSPPNVTILATHLLSEPMPSHQDPPETPWPMEIVALVILAATVALLSASLLGFALCVRLRQISAKVTPEQDIEVYDPPLKTVLGFPSDTKKPPKKLKLDLEKAERASAAWDENSQPSTRCPSSRSQSTISVASSLASSNTHISKQSAHSQLALLAQPTRLSSLQLPQSGKMRDTAPTRGCQGAQLRGGQLQQSRVMTESSRVGSERLARRSSSVSVSSRRSGSSEGSSESRCSKSSGPLDRNRRHDRNSQRTRSRQPSLSRVQEQPELERPRGRGQF
eukprot:TRINITY_DN30240_c0_g1_i1.p1 TRINITY_DN30240_c0_g1~~TRINITY_DN30240_c0_g1_i1.p1  ORF type:complete len:840 (-),score=121.67 TRINITY_DN30240_c0_g1_i1:226-2745(-)